MDGTRRSVVEAMGTVISIEVADPPLSAPAIAAALAEVSAFLEQIDADFSTYRPSSVISKIAAGALAEVDAPHHVRSVLGAARAWQLATDGLFTVTPFGRLDPSGFVKGWAIERASELLSEHGSIAHLVAGGGDVQAVGKPVEGQWRIAVADPFSPERLLGVVEGVDLAIATSGTAERGAHVATPDGHPLTLASVTVIGRYLADVDALATAALAAGPGALDLVARFDCDAMLVGPTGELTFTSGFSLLPVD